MEGGTPPASTTPGMIGLEMALLHQDPDRRCPHPQIRHHFKPEIEPKFSEEGSKLPSPSSSPWQRMKWTDGMIRLLIMVVYCMDSDSAAADVSADQAKGKKTQQHQQQTQQQQKKGKWKSVSRAMMEKGFFVSPQQCEDKFNDLNKRYKRVNDLLGRGHACRVVENQSLLNTMDHLSPKTKEEARKLLNSKHLFFREMCAFHNANPASVSASASASPPTHHHHHHHPLQSQRSTSLDDDQENDTEELDDDEFYGDNEDDDDEDSKDLVANVGQKRARGEPRSSVVTSLSLWSSAEMSAKQLSCELRGVSGGQREWMRMRVLELEEQRVGYEYRALQLERQRFKWLRFSGNKERDMERSRLENERLRLENERMLLQLRQKEFELLSGGVGEDSAPVVGEQLQQ